MCNNVDMFDIGVLAMNEMKREVVERAVLSILSTDGWRERFNGLEMVRFSDSPKWVGDAEESGYEPTWEVWHPVSQPHLECKIYGWELDRELVIKRPRSRSLVFAKLFETLDYGQILCEKTFHEERGECIRLRFQVPDMVGSLETEVPIIYQNEEDRDMEFDMLTKKQAIALIEDEYKAIQQAIQAKGGKA